MRRRTTYTPSTEHAMPMMSAPINACLNSSMLLQVAPWANTRGSAATDSSIAGSVRDFAGPACDDDAVAVERVYIDRNAVHVGEHRARHDLVDGADSESAVHDERNSFHI